MAEEYARAKHAYTARGQNDLSMAKGDLFRLIERASDEWWHVSILDKEGFVPASYMQLVQVVVEGEDTPPPPSSAPPPSTALSSRDTTATNPLPTAAKDDTGGDKSPTTLRRARKKPLPVPVPRPRPRSNITRHSQSFDGMFDMAESSSSSLSSSPLATAASSFGTTPGARRGSPTSARNSPGVSSTAAHPPSSPAFSSSTPTTTSATTTAPMPAKKPRMMRPRSSMPSIMLPPASTLAALDERESASTSAAVPSPSPPHSSAHLRLNVLPKPRPCSEDPTAFSPVTTTPPRPVRPRKPLRPSDACPDDNLVSPPTSSTSLNSVESTTTTDVAVADATATTTTTTAAAAAAAAAVAAGKKKSKPPPPPSREGSRLQTQSRSASRTNSRAFTEVDGELSCVPSASATSPLDGSALVVSRHASDLSANARDPMARRSSTSSLEMEPGTSSSENSISAAALAATLNDPPARSSPVPVKAPRPIRPRQKSFTGDLTATPEEDAAVLEVTHEQGEESADSAAAVIAATPLNRTLPHRRPGAKAYRDLEAETLLNEDEATQTQVDSEAATEADATETDLTVTDATEVPSDDTKTSDAAAPSHRARKPLVHGATIDSSASLKSPPPSKSVRAPSGLADILAAGGGLGAPRPRKPDTSTSAEDVPTTDTSADTTTASDTEPTATTANSPAAEVRSVWSEHVNDKGKVYYHNSTTNVTTWDRPPELDAPSPSVTPTPPATSTPSLQQQSITPTLPVTPAPAVTLTSSAASAAAAPPPIDAAWREARDPRGRVYYYNSITRETSWVHPSLKPQPQKQAPQAQQQPQQQPLQQQQQQQQQQLQQQQSQPQVSQRRLQVPPNRALGAQQALSTGAFATSSIAMSETSPSRTLEGTVVRKIIADGSKKPSRNWTSMYATLRGEELNFFKDQRASASNGRPLSSFVMTASSVDIVADHKRKYVLSSKTSNGTEFLLQCENSEQLFEWHMAIAALSNPYDVGASWASVRGASRPTSTMSSNSNTTPSDFDAALAASTSLQSGATGGATATGASGNGGATAPSGGALATGGVGGGPTAELSKKQMKEEEKQRKKELKKIQKTAVNDPDFDDAAGEEKKKKVKKRLKKLLDERVDAETLKSAGILQETVFGGSLEALVERNGVPVPHFITACIEQVDLRGTHVVGIYRLSGSSSLIQKIRYNWDHDIPTDFSAPEYSDINSITGALKLYFRELPNPLIPFEFFADFMIAIKLPKYDDRLIAIKATISRMPMVNVRVLQHLALHLYRVSEMCEENKMAASNLAIVFGPTLMRAENETPEMMVNMNFQGALVELFILQHQWLFDMVV